MLVGAMNNPAADPLEEMVWMAEIGFDFLDLTVEPPGAAVDGLRPEALRRRAGSLGLKIVGHTFWGLPIGSPIRRLRRAAVEQLTEDVRFLADVGVPGVTIHPDSRTPHFFKPKESIAWNLESLGAVEEVAAPLGVQLWLENMPGLFSQPRHLRPLLQGLPRAGMTLDVGHAHLRPEGSLVVNLIRKFGDRLAHVHLSDNKGGSQDLHLPLGVGSIDWAQVVAELRQAGFDGTVTLEVFAEDLDYRRLSLRKFREWWAG